MDRSVWLKFLKDIEHLQMFSLCSDFDELSLEEKDKGARRQAKTAEISLVPPV